MLARDLLDHFCLGVASYPAELDVNNATSAQSNCMSCVGRRLDRFVKTNRSLNLLLQLSMIEHVVVSQGLLEHHQLEFIERLKKRQVGQPVSRIRVAHQLNLWKAFAHPADNIEVPIRLDLDFDSLVTGP